MSFGRYGGLGTLTTHPNRVRNGSCGDERRPIFHRGLLGFKCIVFGRVWDSWLVVARVLCRSVGMAVWVLSLHIQTATKTVHVAMNIVQSFIADCSASSVSFLAGFGTHGWLWLEFYVDRSVWRSGYSHYTSKPRQKRCTWRQMASFSCFVSRTISLYLSTSLYLPLIFP